MGSEPTRESDHQSARLRSEARTGSGKLSSVVVIGLSETAVPVAEQMALAPGEPTVRGVILLREVETDATSPLRGAGLAMGTLKDLPILHAKHHFDTALVTLPRAMNKAIEEIRAQLAELGIAFRFLPTIYDAIIGSGADEAPMSIKLAELVGREPRAIDSALVRRAIAGRRVAITGAGGSIGSDLCRIAAAYEPAELLLIERAENALFEIDRELALRFPKTPRRALLHDVVEDAETAAIFERYRPEVVFHAAAHKHVPMMEDHPAHAVNNNVFGTRSVAQAALAVGAERFILISTDKAVNPSSVMGATKRFAELFVRSLNDVGPTRFSMVRFGNVLGSSGSVLTVWAKQIAAGRAVTITDPRMTRYFMTIPEAAVLVIQTAGLSACQSAGADVYVLDMGEPVRIVELAKRFIAAHGLTPTVEPIEASSAGDRLAPSHPIAISGIRPGEKLHEQLAHEAEQLQPTAIAGVNAWAGPALSKVESEALMTDLSRIRKSLDAEAVLAAIRKWTPTLPNRVVCPGENMKIPAPAA